MWFRGAIADAGALRYKFDRRGMCNVELLPTVNSSVVLDVGLGIVRVEAVDATSENDNAFVEVLVPLF